MTNQVDLLPLVTVCLVGTLATMVDLRVRRIPNALTGTAAASGLMLAAVGVSQISVGASLLGLVLGALLMLPGHLLGATGGGDVKLLAALGTVLGPESTALAFVFTAIAGGILATAFALGRGRLRVTLGRILARLSPSSPSNERAQPLASELFPYGPAIAVGATLAMIVQG